MPTYDYKCLKCLHSFEKFQSMKEDSLKICPECGGEIKRLIGAGAGAIFRGSGFYQTDYKNTSPNSKKNSSEKTNPVTKTDAKKAENKTESKTTTDNK